MAPSVSRCLFAACVVASAAALSADGAAVLQPEGNASAQVTAGNASDTAAMNETSSTQAKAEPAKAEPAKAEPAKAEPAKAEPINDKALSKLMHVGLPKVTIPGIETSGCLAMDVDAAMQGITSQLAGVQLFVAQFLNVGIFGASIFIAISGQHWFKPAVGTVAFISGYNVGSMLLNQYALFAANVNEMAATACDATKKLEEHVSFDVSPCDFALPYEPCYTPLLGAIVIGLICTGFALWLLDWVVFVMGAAVGVVVVGQAKEIMMAFYPEYYAQMTMTVPYWGIAVGFALVGGLIAKWQEKGIFLLATSAVGGFGASTSFRSVFALYGISIPEIGDMVVFIAVAVGGAIVQCTLCAEKKEKEVVKEVEKKEEA